VCDPKKKRTYGSEEGFRGKKGEKEEGEGDIRRGRKKGEGHPFRWYNGGRGGFSSLGSSLNFKKRILADTGG